MNILLCTLGASWAVVAEVFGFVAPGLLDLFAHHPRRRELENPRLKSGIVPPDEIWLCTTAGSETDTSLKSLREWWSIIGEPLPLRVWRAAGTEQLTSSEECRRFRELAYRLTLLAGERAGVRGQVVLSLAGGRKTMSADMQRAATLFGCRALLHVVGPDRLPEKLQKADPAFFAEPLPRELAKQLIPVVIGKGQRSDMLDMDYEGRRVDTGAFPLPNADLECLWHAPEEGLLIDEISRREEEGSALLGNYLEALSRDERHENWRNLYRLPPAVIAWLRETALGPGHREALVALPKADLHRHIGGCLDIADQRKVGLAVWETMTGSERTAAQEVASPLLKMKTEWPWDWPESLPGDLIKKSHICAALLVHADDAMLNHNLYGVTEPRFALKEKHARGFAAYSRPGDLTGSAILGHPAAVAPYSRAIIRQAKSEGLVYLELRGSPNKYRQTFDGQFRFLENLASILSEESSGDLRVRFVIIGDRSGTREQLKDVVDLAVQARSELGGFVAGIDLAGDESRNSLPLSDLAREFLPAFEACIPVTIHAGEGEPAKNIWESAYLLHADRIGHGLTLLDRPELLERFRDRQIAIELCPTSNIEVVGYRDPDRPGSESCPPYPLFDYWEKGVPVAICTDNPAISRTTQADEYLTAARLSHAPISLWTMLAMVKQSFVHSFLPAAEKEKLLKETDRMIFELARNLCPLHQPSG